VRVDLDGRRADAGVVALAVARPGSAVARVRRAADPSPAPPSAIHTPMPASANATSTATNATGLRETGTSDVTGRSGDRPETSVVNSTTSGPDPSGRRASSPSAATAASSACFMSSALANRFARSLSIALSAICSSSSGILRSGRRTRGATGCSVRCLVMMPSAVSAVNGTLP